MRWDQSEGHGRCLAAEHVGPGSILGGLVVDDVHDDLQLWVTRRAEFDQIPERNRERNRNCTIFRRQL